MSDVLTAEDVIRQHDLKPHPEGGWFRETFRDATRPHGRAHSTAILFLMKAGEVPRWHKVDAAELWQYGGAPLLLEAGRGIDTGSAPIGTKATPACRGAGACLAERAGPRGVDSARQHRCARLRFRGPRTRAPRFRAVMALSYPRRRASSNPG